MMKTCPECAHNCAQNAIFCPSCGYTFTSVPSNVMKAVSARSRVRRLPNGFGSIKKLSGRRRKPYAAYPPTEAYHDNGTPVYRSAIGYFVSYNEAYSALMAYNESPYDERNRHAPFSEIYRLFMKDKFPEGNTLSAAAKKTYTFAYSKSAKLYGRIYSELRPDDFQEIVDNLPLGYTSKRSLVILYKQMGKFALSHDIVNKDYAQFISVSTPNDNEKGVPFTMEEINEIVRNGDQIGLVLLYTGMRISELNTVKRIDEHFIRGGLKTKAGKNRLIPLHPVIQNFQFQEISTQAYRKQFKERYPGHTPHDLRHTTTWLMQTCNCDNLCTRMILGHSLGPDIEQNTYGHRTQEQLYETILQLPDFTKKATTPFQEVAGKGVKNLIVGQ